MDCEVCESPRSKQHKPGEENKAVEISPGGLKLCAPCTHELKLFYAKCAAAGSTNQLENFRKI